MVQGVYFLTSISIKYSLMAVSIFITFPPLAAVMYVTTEEERMSQLK